MTSRFNFYDFLGYLIPGALATLLTVYSVVKVLGMGDLLRGNVSSVGQTTLFLIFSYLIGHLMQAWGRNIENKEKNKWGGYFSVQFLKPDNNHFSSDLKTAIKQKASEYFGIQI